MGVYTQTVTFANGQTADGGEVQTEVAALGNSVNNIVDAQVSASANIAISKTTLAVYTAPTAYNPTWTADSGSPSIGNGTITGKYSQIGKYVFFRVQITMGSTTNKGTADAAANWRIGLPIAAADKVHVNINAYVLDSGTGENVGYGGKIPSGGVQYCYVGGESTSFFDAITPMIWATSDSLIVEGVYEVD